MFSEDAGCKNQELQRFWNKWSDYRLDWVHVQYVYLTCFVLQYESPAPFIWLLPRHWRKVNIRRLPDQAADTPAASKVMYSNIYRANPNDWTIHSKTQKIHSAVAMRGATKLIWWSGQSCSTVTNYHLSHFSKNPYHLTSHETHAVAAGQAKSLWDDLQLCLKFPSCRAFPSGSSGLERLVQWAWGWEVARLSPQQIWKIESGWKWITAFLLATTEETATPVELLSGCAATVS